MILKVLQGLVYAALFVWLTTSIGMMVLEDRRLREDHESKIRYRLQVEERCLVPQLQPKRRP